MRSTMLAWQPSCENISPPRSQGNMSGSKVSSINIAANISDSLHALKLLATHPQIDASLRSSHGMVVRWHNGTGC